MLFQNIVADMRKVLAKHPQIEQQRLHRRVFLENINPDNQALLVSILINTLCSFPIFCNVLICKYYMFYVD